MIPKINTEEEYNPSLIEKIIPYLNRYQEAELKMQLLIRKGVFGKNKIKSLSNKKYYYKKKIEKITNS